MRIAGRLAALWLMAPLVWAQYVVSTSAGIIHFITGEVFVDGKPANWPLVSFPLLAEGHVLATGNGRAEVLLGPGVFMRIDSHSAVRMLDSSLEGTEVEIQRGTALVEVVDIPKGTDVHVVLGPTRTGFRGIGLHRFEAASRLLRVFGGRAEVVAGRQRADEGRGAAVHLGDTLSVSKFNPRRKDDLLVWSANRSFQLFISNLEAPSHPTNWEITTVISGSTFSAPPKVTSDRDRTYYSNRDFGVMFYAHQPAGPNPALHAPVAGNGAVDASKSGQSQP